MTTHGVLAAVVTMKERGDLALRALRSLRPHVDHLALYCNGYDAVPEWLRPPHASHGLVDFIAFDLEGKARDLGNLHFASSHAGPYLSCDDDLEYAPQYPLILTHWIERYPTCIVTTHGLRFKPGTKVWKTITVEPKTVVVSGRPVTKKARVVTNGWEFQTRWDKPLMHKEYIHQPGTGVMGWDTRRVRLGPHPSHVAGESDLSVALWAYVKGVPVLAIPHGGWECSDILPKDAPSLWASSKASNFSTRNAMIRTQDWSTTHQ